MKNETLIEWLKELPPDYDICFSEYTSMVMDSTEEYFVVLDCPVVGILKNDDTKEIRFFTETSEERVIKQIEGGKDWRKLE